MELIEELKTLDVSEPIFKDVKYYVSGKVDDKVLELLNNGGASRLNYFSDYVTHLICGDDADENDLSEANEIYEIPAVTIKWIVMCVKLKRLVNTKPYLFNTNKLFSRLVFTLSKLHKDREALWAIITYHGGHFQLNLNQNCTHLITTDITSEKYKTAFSLGPENIAIVTPDWILESIKNNQHASVELFHPKLIQWPKILKHESTTAITGFEPEQSENLPETSTSDSTQALLDKLKQRMPWNQPQGITPTTVSNITSTADIVPPNVIAPTYTGPKLESSQINLHQLQQRIQQQQQLNLQQQQQQSVATSIFSQNQTSLTANQIPRSIVHHTPQALQQQGQFQTQANVFSQANTNQIGFNRILDQLHPQRPNIQGQITRLTQQQQYAQQVRAQFSQTNSQPRIVSPQTSATTLIQQQVQTSGNLSQQSGGLVNQQIGQPQILQPGIIQRHVRPSIATNLQQLQMQNRQTLNQTQLLQQQLQQGQIGQPQVAQISQNQINQQVNQQINQSQITTPSSHQQHINQAQINSNQINPISQQIGQNQIPQTQINQQINQIGPQQINQQISQGQTFQSNQQLIQNQNFQSNVQQPQQSIIQQQQQGIVQQQQQGIVQQQQQGIVQQQQQQQGIVQQQQQGIVQQQQQAIVQQQQGIVQQQQGILQQQQQQGIVQQTQQQQMLTQTKLIANQFNQQQILPQSSQQQQQQNIIANQQQPQQFTSSQFVFNQQQQMTNQQTSFNQQQQLIQPQQPEGFIQQQQQPNINIPLLQQQQQQQQQNQQQIITQQVLQQQPNQQIINSPQPNLTSQQQIGMMNQPANQAVQFNQPNIPNQAQQHRPINQLWQQQQAQQLQQQQQQLQQQQQIQQQPQPQQQQLIRQPGNVLQVGSRLQWSPNQQQGVPQRQFIQLDAQTHQQLQQMAPHERALFIAKLQKQKQLILQRQQLQMQQQRGGQIVIRSGSVPPGLNPQQQVQWIHQQAKQQGVVLQSANIQQNITNIQAGSIQHAPGLSPIQQNQPFTDQNQQLQIQRQFRFQQLQLQREQAQKNAQTIQQQQQQPAGIQQNIVRPIGQPQPVVDINPHAVDSNVPQNPLVNAKTKTALANMLSIRLQSGGSNIGPSSEPIAEPSAAGTLRLMTAQHNAALNSNNRPQDLLALQQRRPINGSNAELVRPAGAPSVPPAPDPQKLQYSPRNTIPIQHRPGPFYGHNPNLKLPPDLFLLGCIFVVVELERFLEESLPGWQQKIEKHGGEIEKQYCSRVTHVLCETQRHGVVMQALRDYKRCVTLYWLSDVINRKQVLPPWTALHLPMMYLDTLPASKHLISLCGFTGTERSRVKHMIKYIGATFTSYFSKHNTLLIAAKVEGPKYQHAKKWGTPIVNIQWLTDVMLGNFTALNQIEHIKYQQFSNPPNFSFDPMLVPNLMHAWKMPINISQESYEKVKRSPSPVVIPKKVKKMKLEQPDENENVEDVSLQPTNGYRILFSMCNDVEDLKKIVRQLGGSTAKSHKDCTHLVMPHLARTNKLLYCVSLGTYILPESWLRDSLQAIKFLDESNYSLDTKEFNREYKCDFQQTLNTKNRNRLFEGKYFFITPSVYPNKKVLTELIYSCGGIVEKNRRSITQIEATNINSPYSYVILTHENDLHLVADLLRNKKEKIRIVCNVELILSAILKQTFEVEPYAVKVL